ncbi:MAG: hypothetical protein KGI95_31120, partial [Pseudomonas sp.]|nr:hypothetical protein [Pseudomonas sp.]
KAVMNRDDRIDCNAMRISATPNQASQLGALLRLSVNLLFSLLTSAVNSEKSRFTESFLC